MPNVSGEHFKIECKGSSRDQEVNIRDQPTLIARVCSNPRKRFHDRVRKRHNRKTPEVSPKDGKLRHRIDSAESAFKDLSQGDDADRWLLVAQSIEGSDNFRDAIQAIDNPI